LVLEPILSVLNFEDGDSLLVGSLSLILARGNFGRSLVISTFAPAIVLAVSSSFLSVNDKSLVIQTAGLFYGSSTVDHHNEQQE